MSKQFPHPFGDLAGRYRAMRRKLPATVSQMAVTTFKENFKAQGLVVTAGQVEKWKPRQKPRGRSNPARRAILIKTGRLRRSLRAAPTYDYARVVTSVPYAAIHNRGGQMRGQKRAYATNLRSGLTKLRQSGSPAMMPARPFMVTTPLLLSKVGTYMQGQLEQLFNTAESK